MVIKVKKASFPKYFKEKNCVKFCHQSEGTCRGVKIRICCWAIEYLEYEGIEYEGSKEYKFEIYALPVSL